MFQQILRECLENGILCQISLNPKESVETLLKKGYFKDSPFACEDCNKVTIGEVLSRCVKSPPCFHQINNGKIVSVNVTKKEPVRYFQFYFSATFYNKLRPKSEETITILVDDKYNIVSAGDFSEDHILLNELVDILDSKAKLEHMVFDKMKSVAEEASWYP